MKVCLRVPWWRRTLRRLGREALRVGDNNEDTRIRRNGERWLLRALLTAHARAGTPRPFVVIDAGANRGDYTRAVLQLAAEAGCAPAVHVFEPSPACVGALSEAFSGTPNVRITAAALSDRAGEAVLHDGRTGSSLASLAMRPRVAGEAGDRITVPLMRLDDYCQQHGLERIDLLKLDVEGWELAALRGAGDWLEPSRIDVVQFEYGGATMDAGATLRDLYSLFEGRGYTVGKLFPSAIEARRYAPWMEHYAYANYVAIASRWLSSAR